MLDDHHFGDLGRELLHSIEEPARRFSSVERKGSATGTLWHQ
jgi:hypothetical protein